ncbi:MAG TPA: forespore capture DNA-binding protein RefZ [Candidatus Avamphibacillus sp.]|nr:forespore capture DNA-binding protein RefZ [Candidatus Avamphibacillus sp.]
MKTNPTKEKVIESATSLFYQKGFAGTSVRDIAEKADVNVSLISYYFKGKQGLLEYAVTQFYETYLSELETTIKTTQSLHAIERLKKLIFTIIQYKQNNYQLTCFIHRELSLDSVFVREMTVTYLAKENHYISKIFFLALKENNNKNGDRHLMLMQLKGMLITPYVMQNEWRNQIGGSYSNDLFVNRYVKIIEEWLEFIIFQNKPMSISLGNTSNI